MWGEDKAASGDFCDLSQILWFILYWICSAPFLCQEWVEKNLFFYFCVLFLLSHSIQNPLDVQDGSGESHEFPRLEAAAKIQRWNCRNKIWACSPGHQEDPLQYLPGKVILMFLENWEMLGIRELRRVWHKIQESLEFPILICDVFPLFERAKSSNLNYTKCQKEMGTRSIFPFPSSAEKMSSQRPN